MNSTVMSFELMKAMQLAKQAGETLKKYHGTRFTVEFKRDKYDPVTIADRESDNLLRMGIQQAFPNDEILSEENPLPPRTYQGRVWMVDPLDDTKGFVAGRDTPGVMLGLCEGGKPILGVVYQPLRNEWYYGEVGRGSFRIKNSMNERLQVRQTVDISKSVLAGRNILRGDVRPLDAAVGQLGFSSTIPEGCLGAEIGLIAAGEADAFIQTSTKASKWDTLAAQVILTEAGGAMCDIDGKALDYKKPESGWDRFVLAAATKELLLSIQSKLQAMFQTTSPYRLF